MKVDVTKYKTVSVQIKRILLAIEEPIEIRIEGTPTAVSLRSPEHS